MVLHGMTSLRFCLACFISAILNFCRKLSAASVSWRQLSRDRRKPKSTALKFWYDLYMLYYIIMNNLIILNIVTLID
jgi:hypothetical protein